MSAVQEIFDSLHDHFGPPNWWPATSAFEVCVGAILTQNTAWRNVTKAIDNLKREGALSFEAIEKVDRAILAEWIRPSGYFNQKSARLKGFVATVREQHGSFEALQDLGTDDLREFFLSIKGIGPETADSMVLYAFEKPVFVVDAYTHRILSRHQLIEREAGYYQIQEYLSSHLDTDVQLYNDYHALLVQLGNEFCKRSKPNCDACPLKEVNGGPVLDF